MGTKDGKPGYIDWLTENYCIHCDKIWFKGLKQCPDCRLCLRIVPHNHYHKTTAKLTDIKRKMIKKAQTEASILLRNNGFSLPPQRCSAK